VPIGCVQGSVLGPRLFNLYTSKIPECFPHEVKIVTYADDTYVIVWEENEEDLKKKVEDCINSHCRALIDLGMIVNAKKTEAVLFGKTSKRIEFKCGADTITAGPGMKVLGVYFDEHLTWKEHVEKTLSKMSRLTAGLRFLRKRLSKTQFLNATTSQFYGTLYYGCQVWLGYHTRMSLIRKLNSIHYKVLRIVEHDWKKKKKRHELDKIGRAKPTKWMSYSTGTLVIKIMRDKFPFCLYEKLSETVYQERRKPNRLLFYDKSISKFEFQAIQNRIRDYFYNFNFNHFPEINNNQLRIQLKKSLNF